MSNILVVTGTLSGILYPALELARRLTQDGHDLVYASFGSARSTIAAHGIDYVPLATSRYDSFVDEDRLLGVGQRWRHIDGRRQRALDALAVDDFAADVRRLAPDLILIDGEMHEHVLTALASGRSVALLNCFVSIWRRPGLPPPHHLARPGVGWRGSAAGMWLLWQLLAWRKRLRGWRQWIRRAGCDRPSLLRRLAERNRLDVRRLIDAGQWLIPFTYRDLPCLSLHALEFEFLHTPPSHVHYIGPLVAADRRDDRLDGPSRERLGAIIEERKTGKVRLIYAGFGSFFSADPGLLRRLLAAVATRSDWRLILSLGGRGHGADLGPLPDNVATFSWLPQPEVLRHADAAVTHGGINTIDECVLRGVPMLIYCGFETDMAGNTSRVVHHGLGLAGTPDDSPDTIRRHLDRLVEGSGFARALDAMGSSYRRYAEKRVAEATIRGLLSGGLSGA